MSIKSASVFCGSSSGSDPKWVTCAQDFGAALANNNIKMIYGGGTTGLMGACATACANAGGKITGITTEYLQDHEGKMDKIADIHVVATMHQRKLMMFEHSDACIALPGGFGTLDELFEIMTWKQIGLHKKPIILLNTFGYWDSFIELLKHMTTQGFIRQEDQNIFFLAPDTEKMLEYIEICVAQNNDFVAKWG